MPTFDYIAKQGECLDAVIFRLYGNEFGVTEEVLRLNPGLFAVAASIPHGKIIKMPVLEKHTKAEKVNAQVNLWE